MLSLFMIWSCQEEIIPEIEVDPDGIISGNPLAKAIIDVTTKDGSEDNIIDRSSCTTVLFPIKGLLQDVETTFENLEEVQDLGAGALEVEWLFPIEVILYDHTKITLENEDELEDIQESCIEGGNDSDNECIDFIYPISVQVYNVNTENFEIIELKSDFETFNLFSTEDLIATIDYPIELIDFTDNISTIFSSEELLNVISQNDNSCDEEDIIEFEYLIIEELRTLFSSNSWQIRFFEEDTEDKTSLFASYIIQFNTNLTLESVSPEIITGEWDIELLDFGDGIRIEFDTDNEPLILLNELWFIKNRNGDIIELETTDSADSNKRLHLSLN